MKRVLNLLVIILSIFVFNVTSASAEAPADAVYEVNGNYKSKFSDILKFVPNDTKTTITLLKDQNEAITIPNGKNIVLDLNQHTLSVLDNKNVISNNGILEIINGTVTSDVASGMINNNQTGTLYLNEGTYKATGKRQAIYNDGGTLYISGSAELESASTERATVHNRRSGKIYITGGTITSTGLYAIYNENGSIDIGTKDNKFDKSKPIIQGKTFGIAANNTFNFYDGIIRGLEAPVGKTSNTGNTPNVTEDKDQTKVNDIEVDAEKKTPTNDDGYKEFYYFIDESKIKITFDPTGGEVSPTYIKITIGDALGTLPVPSRVDYSFDGWFTDETGGVKITEYTTPIMASTYYAHWTYVDPNSVATVEGVGDMSLKEAFLQGGNITLNKDVIITEPLAMPKEATLNLNGHTITLNDNYIMIEDKVKITDLTDDQKGKITSTDDFTIYVGYKTNYPDASLTLEGGTIEGLGIYGAIWNYETTIIDGGTVTGTASTPSEYEGQVIYNTKNLIIKSGTVYSSNGHAVQVYKNSTFTMDGGLLKSDATNDQTLNLWGDCSATINGGTIEGLQEETAGIAMFGNTNLTINGGTIIGHSMAVAGNGNAKSSNANITINGGDLISLHGVGIYYPQRDSVAIINGGTISGPTGIEVRSSQLIVNDGTIIATSDTYSVNPETNGTTSKGIAIAVSQHTTQMPIDVTINGGTLKGIVPLVEANPLNNPEEAINKIKITVNKGNFVSTGDRVMDIQDEIPISLSVTGGFYTTDPSQYVSEGYGVVKHSKNLYEVTKVHNIVIEQGDTNIISVNSTKYPYKETVLLNIKDGNKYSVTVTVKDANGNTIKLNNNSFIMPDSDVTISVEYEKIINPTTNDNMSNYMIMLTISSFGLIIFTKKLIKA